NRSRHVTIYKLIRQNVSMELLSKCFEVMSLKITSHGIKVLHKIACAPRTSVHEVTKLTPYFINFGREISFPNSVLPDPGGQELLMSPSHMPDRCNGLSRDERGEYKEDFEDVENSEDIEDSKYIEEPIRSSDEANKDPPLTPAEQVQRTMRQARLRKMNNYTMYMSVKHTKQHIKPNKSVI
ncbi:hypothetical protein CBL_20286, partial [Carabus blaptoides fortunei]